MTQTRFLVLVPVFAAGLALGFVIPAPHHPSETKVTNLVTEALAKEFTPDREVLVDLVEFPPNQKLEWHWHPGEEFHYYLEGNVLIERVGAPSINGTPGTVGHVGFKQRHQAIAGEKGAKLLVFRVHTKGEPMRYLDPKKGMDNPNKQ